MSRGKKKFPVPEGFDPFAVLYGEGSSALRSRLLDMDATHLKGLLARFTSIPRKVYESVNDQGLLAGLVVKETKETACRSQSFGDYKLSF